jgi:hypothetical protein
MTSSEELPSRLKGHFSRAGAVAVCCILFLSLAGLSHGNQFGVWIADTQGQYSNGDPLTSALKFEIGAFAVGFTPTSANVGQWEANWISSGLHHTYAAEFWNYGHPQFTAVGYSAAEVVVRPGAPEGEAVYLWGYTSKDLSGVAEWILLSIPATFPTGTPVGDLFFPGDWFTTTGAETTMVLGTAFNHPNYPDWEDFLLRVLQTASVGQVAMSQGYFDLQSSGTFAGDELELESATGGGTIMATTGIGPDSGLPAAGGTGHTGESALLAFMRWIHGSGVSVRETGFGHHPAGDVFSNIQKYFLRFDPTYPYPASLQNQFSRDWSHGGQTYPGIRFLHNKTVADVQYVLQRSTNLESWEIVPSTQQLAAQAYTGTDLPTGPSHPSASDLEWLTVIDLDPPSADRVFYRIKFEPHSWRTVYVSTFGTDTNNDGTQPFRTIAAAFAKPSQRTGGRHHRAHPGRNLLAATGRRHAHLRLRRQRSERTQGDLCGVSGRVSGD